MLIEKKYKLKGRIIQQGLNSEKVAESIGINKATFYRKLNNGSFTIADVKKLVEILKLTNEEVMDIFFNQKVS